MSASMVSFVYIWVMCFNISAENNQRALVIIQPIWNSHFLRLLFIFVAAIFLTRCGSKISLMWTRPPQFQGHLSQISIQQKIIALQSTQWLHYWTRLIYSCTADVQGMTACEALNRCLESLASEYPSVKFCRIRASEARLSINFVCVCLFLFLSNKSNLSWKSADLVF